MMPEVSVIIPVFNCESTIGKAVQSAREQTVTDIEIIVVDDASTDGTVKAVKGAAGDDRRIKLVISEKNAGVGGASRKGIEIAAGEWVTKLDADDWCEACRLEQLLKAAKQTGADAVADNLLIFDHSAGKVVERTKLGNSPVPRMLSPAEVFNLDNPFIRTPLGYIKPFIRRKFLIENNLAYQEQCRTHEDFALLAELSLCGAKIVLIPEAYYTHVRRVSPSTGRISPYSRSGADLPHLKISDWLVDKYRAGLSPEVMQAIKHRRKLFSVFIVARKAKQAVDNGEFGRAVYLALINPGVYIYGIIVLWRRARNKLRAFCSGAHG